MTEATSTDKNMATKIKSKDIVFLFFWIIFAVLTTHFFLNETIQSFLNPIGWHTWLESLNYEMYNFYFSAFSKDNDRYMLAFVWNLPILFFLYNFFVFKEAYKRNPLKKEVLTNEKKGGFTTLFALLFVGAIILFIFTYTPLRPFITDRDFSIKNIREFFLLHIALILLVPILLYWVIGIYRLFCCQTKN